MPPMPPTPTYGATEVRELTRAQKLGYWLGLKAALREIRRYERRMREAMKKPHPYTGRENTIAACKHDAAQWIRARVAALGKQ